MQRSCIDSANHYRYKIFLSRSYLMKPSSGGCYKQYFDRFNKRYEKGLERTDLKLELDPFRRFFIAIYIFWSKLVDMKKILQQNCDIDFEKNQEC